MARPRLVVRASALIVAFVHCLVRVTLLVEVAEVQVAVDKHGEGDDAGPNQRGTGPPAARKPPFVADRPPGRWRGTETPVDAEADQQTDAEDGQQDAKPRLDTVCRTTQGSSLHWRDAPVGPFVL